MAPRARFELATLRLTGAAAYFYQALALVLVVRWIFGNPLIAITMLRHDYTAGLFVPVDLLLAEGDGGVGCNITYVLPSSLIAVEQNAPLLAAAQALDAKVEALVSAAVAR